MSADHTMPDPELDVSGCFLASMELGIKSVSWDIVKKELTKDREFQDLVDWITAVLESQSDLRVMDRVPMMGERTVVPRGLRRQVLETLHSVWD